MDVHKAVKFYQDIEAMLRNVVVDGQVPTPWREALIEATRIAAHADERTAGFGIQAFQLVLALIVLDPDGVASQASLKRMKMR